MKIRKSLLAAVLALNLCAGVCGCGLFEEIPNGDSGTASLADLTTTTTTMTTVPPVPPDAYVHMLAVGDDLVQTGVYNAAKAWSADPNSYDFTKTYENIAPIVSAADVAIINQETLICGEGYAVSGSNFNFNSPPELGPALVQAGFDVFTLANNHVRDKQVDGLSACLDYWDSMMAQYPILAFGAYRNAEDQNKIRVQEVNGVKIAYLAYTEHMNGYTIPATSTLKVGLTSDEALMERQIKEARTLADAVIVSAHWGNEDTHTVRADVKALAQKMIDWGADVILGAHPHTAQTMEWLTREDGTKGFVYYSLGNFVSAQTDNFNMVGEIAEFDLHMDGETRAVTIENVTCMPVITHYDNSKFANLRLYPYYMYTSVLANSHGLPYAPLGTAKSFSMEVIDRIVNANIPEEFRKLTWSPDETRPSQDNSSTTLTTAAAMTPGA